MDSLKAKVARLKERRRKRINENLDKLHESLPEVARQMPMPKVRSKFNLLFDESVLTKLEEYISEGVSIKDAAVLAAGITAKQLESILNRGREEVNNWQEKILGGICAQEEWEPSVSAVTWMRVKHAEAFYNLNQLRMIQRASVNDWKAASWLLEKRFPEEYGKETGVSIDELKLVFLTPATASSEEEWLQQSGELIDGEVVEQPKLEDKTLN